MYRVSDEGYDHGLRENNSLSVNSFIKKKLKQNVKTGVMNRVIVKRVLIGGRRFR